MTYTTKFNKPINILGGILLISILFLPEFQVGSGLPTVQLLDILLPVVAIFVVLSWKSIPKTMYWLVPLLFCAYIPITMSINGRSGILSDYFEVYKLMKFSVLILFFSLIDYRSFTTRWFKPIFLTLAAINLLHFYNVFEINDFLLKLYGGIHREFFGLNSLGQPATKRMIGLASNPNINAILFGFFAIYFLPLHFDKKKILWFLGAILLMLLCQSRTSIVAIAGVLLVIATLRISNWSGRNWLWIIGSLLGLYLVSWALTTDFFSYTSYSNNVVSNSAMGRLETWAYLFDMIKEQPIFGYGVNKQYFYSRSLYSENEYILMTWRYGIIGLVLYLALLGIPLWNYFKRSKENTSMKHGMLFLIFILIVALANNPYKDPVIMVLMASMLGLTWPLVHKKEKNG